MPLIHIHNFRTLLYYLFFIFSVQGYAADLLIVTEHSPPYQYLNKSGQIDGLTTEIVHATLAQTAIPYKLKLYPWSRAFLMAKETKNTCIFLMSRDEPREMNFKWVAPLVTTHDYFIGLSARTDININNIEDVKKYKVAVIKDDRAHHELLKLGFVENKNLYIINNSSAMLKLLASIRNIDLILADMVNVNYRAKLHNLNPDTFKSYMKWNSTPVDLYLACNLKTSEAIVNQLKNAIKTIKENGTYDKILTKWRDKQTYTNKRYKSN